MERAKIQNYSSAMCFNAAHHILDADVTRKSPNVMCFTAAATSLYQGCLATSNIDRHRAIAPDPQGGSGSGRQIDQEFWLWGCDR